MLKLLTKNIQPFRFLHEVTDLMLRLFFSTSLQGKAKICKLIENFTLSQNLQLLFQKGNFILMKNLKKLILMTAKKIKSVRI
jgi:hypothetical protein